MTEKLRTVVDRLILIGLLFCVVVMIKTTYQDSALINYFALFSSAFSFGIQFKVVLRGIYDTT
jgi:hypothetical protein